jgi:hypothetical protein
VLSEIKVNGHGQRVGVVVSLSSREHWLVMHVLVDACAEATVTCPARHAQLLQDLRVVCRGPVFITTDEGCRVLADLILRQGAACPRDAAAAGSLLARLEAAGARA